METLLIVLVIGCALAFVVQVGRGIWARARTVERHQQALDTLAGFTQRPEEPEDGFGDPYEHQAHVRLIGPGAQGGNGETASLPPPRALPSNASSSRRPTRSVPSAAAFEPATYEVAWVEPDREAPSPSSPSPSSPSVNRPVRTNRGDRHAGVHRRPGDRSCHAC